MKRTLALMLILPLFLLLIFAVQGQAKDPVQKGHPWEGNNQRLWEKTPDCDCESIEITLSPKDVISILLDWQRSWCPDGCSAVYMYDLGRVICVCHHHQ